MSIDIGMIEERFSSIRYILKRAITQELDGTLDGEEIIPMIYKLISHIEKEEDIILTKLKDMEVEDGEG